MAGSDSEQWTWAQCEYCLKWRRLADETYIDDTQEFGCPMIGVKCEDSQEEWSEEDEDEDAMDADGGDTGLSTQEKEFAKWKTMYADNTRESPPPHHHHHHHHHQKKRPHPSLGSYADRTVSHSCA